MIMKKIILIVFLFSKISFAQFLTPGEAKGLFFSLGVGGNIPVSSFSDRHELGAGVNIGFEYTDNKLFPFFVYTKIDYAHFPGKLSYYKTTDYSSIATNALKIDLGIRHYFAPILEEVVFLMPVLEVGPSFTVYERLHEFKIDRNKNNFTEEVDKFGFHVGAGVSMFLLDVMTYYTYFENNQFLSFNLRLRIPIYANI